MLSAINKTDVSIEATLNQYILLMQFVLTSLCFILKISMKTGMLPRLHISVELNDSRFRRIRCSLVNSLEEIESLSPEETGFNGGNVSLKMETVETWCSKSDTYTCHVFNLLERVTVIVTLKNVFSKSCVQSTSDNH